MVEINQEEAKAIAEQTLARNPGHAESVRAVTDGWPSGVYGARDQNVWAVHVSGQFRVGGDRVLVIAKATGEVVADDFVGE